MNEKRGGGSAVPNSRFRDGAKVASALDQMSESGLTRRIAIIGATVHLRRASEKAGSSTVCFIGSLILYDFQTNFLNSHEALKKRLNF